MTGTDSPYAWSNKYGMPILAMVPDAEMSIARKVFGFINSKTKDEESIATAEDYLMFYPASFWKRRIQQYSR